MLVVLFIFIFAFGSFVKPQPCFCIFRLTSLTSLSFQHGIGVPSLSVVFNEILKLVHYAKCTNVTFFRIGTCGGLGKLISVKLCLKGFYKHTKKNDIFITED